VPDGKLLPQLANALTQAHLSGAVCLLRAGDDGRYFQLLR
jgi:hypothetical protein